MQQSLLHDQGLIQDLKLGETVFLTRALTCTCMITVCLVSTLRGMCIWHICVAAQLHVVFMLYTPKRVCRIM